MKRKNVCIYSQLKSCSSSCCLPWCPGRAARRMTTFKQQARHPAAEPEQHRRPRRDHPHPSMDVIQAGASW
ncbi:hypothetical protein ACWGE1_05275 [Streptomyces sp. NPDC054932]